MLNEATVDKMQAMKMADMAESFTHQQMRSSDYSGAELRGARRPHDRL